MITTKKIFRIITLSFLFFIAIAGCKKFLDREPLTATLPDLKQGALESKVYNMYSLLRTYAGFAHLPWLYFHSIRDDDAQKGSDASDGSEVVAMFETFQYAKSGWGPETYWNDHYTMINAANTALEIARTSNLTDEASVRNIAEAHFFRAYSYFDLVRAFGEVPLINFFVAKPSDAVKPKAPVDSIWALIDADLRIASRDLPINSSFYGEGFPGRLTSGAANTLAAQAFIFRQKWDSVINRCDIVINSGQYQLIKFTDIWKDGLNGEGKNGPESIFEMQATVGENGQSVSSKDFGSDWGVSQNVRKSGAPVEWNLGWGFNTPTDKLVNDWPNDDPRKAATILYSGQYDGGAEKGGYGLTLPPYTDPLGTGGFAQKYWNKKVYADPKMRTFTGFIDGGAGRWMNHRLLRYADVILMKAEAANEKGDGATAAAMLEMVRNRASGNLGITRSIVPYIPFLNQNQMRTAIKNERRWEFAMEGYRFFDLVRWGDALSVLAPLGYTNRARYYPIPQSAIDLSGGVLVQNPEW